MQMSSKQIMQSVLGAKCTHYRVGGWVGGGRGALGSPLEQKPRIKRRRRIMQQWAGGGGGVLIFYWEFHTLGSSSPRMQITPLPARLTARTGV